MLTRGVAQACAAFVAVVERIVAERVEDMCDEAAKTLCPRLLGQTYVDWCAIEAAMKEMARGVTRPGGYVPFVVDPALTASVPMPVEKSCVRVANGKRNWFRPPGDCAKVLAVDIIPWKQSGVRLRRRVIGEPIRGGALTTWSVAVTRLVLTPRPNKNARFRITYLPRAVPGVVTAVDAKRGRMTVSS